ncbi:MAG TPA: glycosyltransferase family 4 protein [Candidatus Blautia faecipullorum]|nr:glycosyltransferase family 4 protein [Candidatus Blautia faecipullorum]
MKKKILMLGNSHLVIFGFRGELIERLVKEGYEVIVAFPNGPFGEGKETSWKYGCRFVEIPMNRWGKNPIEEFLLLNKYKKIIKAISPDIVLSYTVKCDIYGGIACGHLGIPYIPNITGLGKGLAEGSWTKIITTALYKKAIKNAQCVFFQNSQDKKFFEMSGIKFNRSKILPGSGVNLEKFKALPYPNDGKVVFTYMARVMKAKGIDQFLDAAKTIKAESPNTEFQICGYCEEDYKGIIDEAAAIGVVTYHGLVTDVEKYEMMSSCVVLPSFHPEGVSNVLLEAAASARPIITTNRPGCRDAVDDGISGFLVKERDSEDLIDKIRKFLSLTVEERTQMGLAGRQKMEKWFDRQIVVDAYMNEISGIVSDIN